MWTWILHLSFAKKGDSAVGIKISDKAIEKAKGYILKSM
jgi:hypothetical protein